MIAGYMNALGGKKFKSILKNEADVFSYLFSSDDGANVYMLWDGGNDVRCTVTVSNAVTGLYDCFGNSKYVKMDGNSISVNIGQRPIYLVLDSNASITDINIGGTETENDNPPQEDVEQDIQVENTDDYIEEVVEDEIVEETEEENVNKTKKKKVIITKKISGSSNSNLYIWIIIISVSAVVLVGGGLTAFLLYNFHPAKVFMGDTGSLFLGGAVCGMAFALNIPLIIPVIGIIYVAEVLSDIIQVAYFKLSHGKRIFRMAPLHHHLEMGGWSEIKLVFVFTLITTLMCMLAFWGIMDRLVL